MSAIGKGPGESPSRTFWNMRLSTVLTCERHQFQWYIDSSSTTSTLSKCGDVGRH